ncbi:tail fiber domain-containing protein [Xanthomarina sp. GH4-25]|uniref:tail fiber domain-containing protein n=1 Tax=Xanthomarina sp. GH4-25 TaxID=3349335 RepID=UPI003877F18A
MKKLSLLIAFCITLTSYAQQSINYKAIVKDNIGNVVANQTIDVQFIIYQQATNVYQETHTPTTDANGLIIVNIGEGTTSDVFTDIDWGTDDHFLNVQINTGSGLTDLGTTQFMAVPYAIQAEKAANVTGLEAIDEGNGVGWRLKDKNPANYNNIGENAVDLSSSSNPSGVYGASGDFSTATGAFTTASGKYSTAMGFVTQAESYTSTAFGRYNVGGGSATSWISTNPLFEIGNGTSGVNRSNALTVLKNGTITAPSFDLNEITDAKALITKEYADANLTSSGLEVLTEGSNTGHRIIGRNPAYYGTIGNNAIDLSYSSGFSLERGATGNYSTAMGYNTTATAYASTVIGRYNTGSGNATSWIATDPLFIIGNGTSNSNKSNAFTVLKNGHIGINKSSFVNAKLDIDHASSQTSPQINIRETSGDYARLSFSNSSFIPGYWTIAGSISDTPSTDRLNFYHSAAGDIMSILGNGNVLVNGSVVHSSDIRLKNNIESIPYGLDQVLQLQPKAYNWIAKPDQENKSLGLIAQDVQSVIKEIVHTADDENKTLSVSYTELIPVLIKAIQEQQEVIDAQQKLITSEKQKNIEQENQFQALLERVERIENNTSP